MMLCLSVRRGLFVDAELSVVVVVFVVVVGSNRWTRLEAIKVDYFMLSSSIELLTAVGGF